MPILVSAKKSLRQSLAKRRQNNKLKKKVREISKKFLKSPNAKNLAQLFSVVDKAKKNKLYHKNKIARLKAQYHKKLEQAKKVVKKTVKKKSE